MAKGRAIITLGLILCAVVSSTFILQTVKAQFKGDININSDGSITQSGNAVQQVDGVYFLTVDTNQSIGIQKANMVFDGNNHTLLGNTLYIQDTSNVTVQNFTVANINLGIEIGSSSDVTITNVTVKNTRGGSLLFSITSAIRIEYGSSSRIIESNIIDNDVGFFLWETLNNSIISNNILRNGIAFAVANSSEDRIYYNNIVNNSDIFQDQGFWSLPYMNSSIAWDNGTVGNYWSDYQGNGTYIIDQNNIDYHPLTQEVKISSIVPEFSWLVIVPLLLSILLVTAASKHRKIENG